MRYREDNDDLFYYDGFINTEDIFDWIFQIEDTVENILEDKHIKVCILTWHKKKTKGYFNSINQVKYKILNCDDKFI